MTPLYTAGTTVGLRIVDGPLPSGRYRLSANSTITDKVGNALDGDGDGTGGDAYRHTFDVSLDPDATFEGRDNDTIAKSTALPLTEEPGVPGLYLARAVGTIDPTSDSDYYSFEAVAGDKVSVAMDAAGASHYGYVEVLNSAGSSIGSAYNYYSANNILHADGITIPTSGTYHVRVFAYRSYYTHTYRLRLDVARGVGLEREDNGSPSSPNQLTFIQAGATRTARVAGALDTTSDYDHFGWGTINAGNSIEITATPLSPSTLERVKLTLQLGGHRDPRR